MVSVSKGLPDFNTVCLSSVPSQKGNTTELFYGSRCRRISLAPNLGIISVATRGNPATEILSDTYHKEISSRKLIAKFRRLFLEDRASPFDIDETGRNLIHVSEIIYTSTKHG